MDDTQNPPTITPVGPAQKEVGPVAGEAYIEPGLERPAVPQELKEIGVEPVHEEIEVPYEARQAGLKPSKATVSPTTKPTGAISIPLTGGQATHILKIHKNVVDAIVWLAVWCLRQLKIVKVRDDNTNS